MVAAKPHSPQEKPREPPPPRLTLAFLTWSLASVNSFLVTISEQERTLGPRPAPLFSRWSHRPWQVKWFAYRHIKLGAQPTSQTRSLVPKLPPEAWGGQALLPAGNTKASPLGAAQGEGFPGRKPALLAILSSSGVYGLPFATWQQLHPARGQGILGLLIHSFLPILYPNSQF